MHGADTHTEIRVRGARVNNLRDIDIDLPKRRLIVFTGLSGSGKSSLVFGTIASESQRLINETYSTFLQGFMPRQARPEVDGLENLTAAIIIDQERMGANARSTVGTATDAYALLRLVFSRLSEPYVGASGAFSFNLPEGMCQTCQGVGKVSSINESALVEKDKSLNEGAITAPGFGVGTWYWKYYAESDLLDANKPLQDYTPDEWQYFMHQEATPVKFGGINTTYIGLIPRIKRTFVDKAEESKQAHVKAFVEKIASFEACPDCHGTRLNDRARTATVNGKTIGECASMQVGDLAIWLDEITDKGIGPLIGGLKEMLAAFVEIGLGYLSLDRESGTLSGGESQRVKMIRNLVSALTDVTYVFDEPTAGLHPHDVQRMNGLLQRLRDKGNSVLVVEHKPEVMAIADMIVDMGPGAGSTGGEVVYQGDLDGLRSADTITGTSLGQRLKLRDTVRQPNGVIEIRDATTNNLQNVSVDIPTGVLVAITGVAGSGKSSLIKGSVVGREGVRHIDQAAIKGSRRSNPATFSGLLDPIRTAFAKANGVKAALFSANSEGACPACNGLGVIYMDLGMMAGVATPCEECGGRRFKPEVLEYELHGKSIDQVLAMSVDEAASVFKTGNAGKILKRLLDVGLGYISIGQPLTSLSGGERQRLKLASSLGSDDAQVYVLDEPTSGLHLADTENLIGMLHRMVDDGKTVIVIEHNLAVMAQADWIVDVGPGAGHDGGTVVFEGTPSHMVAEGDTLTATHLREWLEE